MDYTKDLHRIDSRFVSSDDNPLEDYRGEWTNSPRGKSRRSDRRDESSRTSPKGVVEVFCEECKKHKNGGPYTFVSLR